MEVNPRLTQARQDLSAQITDIYPSPGTILIVHPKEGVQFHPEFSHWLAETLQTLLPIGVKGMVIPENVANFDVIGPLESDPVYQRGFEDAIKAIVELNR